MKKPNFTNYREHNCMYNSALIWDQHGNWQEPRNGFQPTLPEWCTKEFIQDAKEFTKTLIDPKIELWFSLDSGVGSFGGKWITYDSANKIIYFDNAVSGCKSELGAKAYIEKRHFEHKRLFGGVIQALLVYKKTGVACLPDWNTNKIDSFGYKNGQINKVPRAHEVTVT